jgi:hypothetical protein
MTTLPPIPTPPPLGQTSRSGWGDGRPTGLSKATIGLTGGAALLTLLGAWASLSVYDNFDKYVATEPDYDAPYIASQALQSLASMLMIASYVTLALWMTKVHKRLTDAGEKMPLASAWAWFVWLIPLASLVLPYIYFRGLNRRAKARTVGAWWLTYVGSGVASMVGLVQVIALSDFSEAFKDENDFFAGIDMSPLGATGIISAVILAVSWVLLALTLREITARDTSGRDPLLP